MNPSSLLSEVGRCSPAQCKSFNSVAEKFSLGPCTIRTIPAGRQEGGETKTLQEKTPQIKSSERKRGNGRLAAELERDALCRRNFHGSRTHGESSVVVVAVAVSAAVGPSGTFIFSYYGVECLTTTWLSSHEVSPSNISEQQPSPVVQRSPHSNF